MENINNNEQSSFNLCNGCTKCCEYIAMEIDTPETQDDFENIRWYLLHDNVKVFMIAGGIEVDEEGNEEEVEDQWYLQFNTRCKKLSPSGVCTIHSDRPEICRDHSQETCEKYGEEDDRTEFDNAEDFIAWVNNNYDFELTEVWEDEDGNEVDDEPIETFKNEDHL